MLTEHLKSQEELPIHLFIIQTGIQDFVEGDVLTVTCFCFFLSGIHCCCFFLVHFKAHSVSVHTVLDNSGSKTIAGNATKGFTLRLGFSYVLFHNKPAPFEINRIY